MKKFKNVLLFIFLVIFFFCFSYFLQDLINDDLWNYGFAYNIATGLIPYKDFNMIVTPLNAFCNSILILIFGHHLWTIYLFNSILLAITFIVANKNIGKRAYPFIILLMLCHHSYNVLSFCLIIVLITIDQKNIKNKEIILGLIGGMLFLTKQTIGLTIFIPLIYYSKKKLQTLISYFFPILLFVIYLCLSNSLLEFIDYAFLGMLDFGSKNKILLFLPFECIIIIYLISNLIKSKFQDHSSFFALMYQVITIPILDFVHFIFGFLIVFYLCLLKTPKLNTKHYLLITIALSFFIGNQITEYIPSTLYTNNIPYLEGKKGGNNENGIIEVSTYINNIKNQYDNIYLITRYSYLIKLNINLPINKYDMFCNGNMGFNGPNKYIKEIDKTCKKSSCLFLLDHYPHTNKYDQLNLDIINHIRKNYLPKEQILIFDVFTNK